MAGVVEHPDHRVGDLVEDVERQRHPQRRSAPACGWRATSAPARRGRCGGRVMIAKRDGERSPCAAPPRRLAPRSRDQQRLEQPREGRLADPAQRQAGQRDAELGRRQVGVEVRRPCGGRRGRGEPSPGRTSIWVGRTLTSANSAATKKPFANTRIAARNRPAPGAISIPCGGPARTRGSGARPMADRAGGRVRWLRSLQEEWYSGGSAVFTVKRV